MSSSSRCVRPRFDSEAAVHFLQPRRRSLDHSFVGARRIGNGGMRLLPKRPRWFSPSLADRSNPSGMVNRKKDRWAVFPRELGEPNASSVSRSLAPSPRNDPRADRWRARRWLRFALLGQHCHEHLVHELRKQQLRFIGAAAMASRRLRTFLEPVHGDAASSACKRPASPLIAPPGRGERGNCGRPREPRQESGYEDDDFPAAEATSIATSRDTAPSRTPRSLSSASRSGHLGRRPRHPRLRRA